MTTNDAIETSIAFNTLSSLLTTESSEDISDIIKIISVIPEYLGKDWLYELIHLIKEIGMKNTIEYIAEQITKQKSPSETFQNSPSMDDHVIIFAKEKHDFSIKAVIAPGIYACRNPNCTGTRQTITSQKQIRSADEPATVTVYCTICKVTFKLN